MNYFDMQTLLQGLFYGFLLIICYAIITKKNKKL
jgi:hypothetical protein